MAYQQINGANYYYEEHGSGEETIVFSHGFLFSGGMFEKQVEVLKDRYRVITYDHRGQGQSEVTRNGYDVDSLTQDAVELIKSLDAAPCHFAGLSMGGFVALRLAIRHPELLKSLILMETSADPEPKANIPKYLVLAVVARWLSPKLVSGRAMAVMFGKTFLNDPNRVVEYGKWKRIMEANNRIGMYRALQGVIRRQGVYEQLGKIKLPTLVIVGEEDIATVPEKAERIHAAIEGSKLVLVPGAGHTSSVSQPDRVTQAIENFLNGLQD